MTTKTNEPELPLEDTDKKDPDKLDGIGNFMYNELMAESRRQDEGRLCPTVEIRTVHYH